MGHLNTKWMYLFENDEAQLQLNPLSQSTTHLDQNVNKDSNLSSTKPAQEEWIIKQYFYEII